MAIELHNHHVYLPARVAGHDLRFLLDTGAGASLLSMRVAQQLDAPLGTPFDARGAGEGAVHGALFSDSVVASVSAVTGPIALAGALPLEQVEHAEGRAIDGILGYDFIAQHAIEIDYVRRTLRAHDARHFDYNGPGLRLPITFRLSHPHVTASLEIAPGEWVAGDFVIDIGSRLHVALTKPFTVQHELLQRLGPTQTSTIGRGIGGGSTNEMARARKLRVGDWIHEAPEVAMFGEGAGVFTTGLYFEGNIGGGILCNYRLFLDYRRCRIILEHVS
jgi:Aspartyl protease